MGELLRNAGAKMSGRNFVLLLDTATTALTNVVLVVVAARSLLADELDSFSLGQLVVVTLVGAMRAALYSPAMAAQRVTGPARIPLSWVIRIGLPLSAAVSAVICFFMGRAQGSPLMWFGVLTVGIFSAIAQDGARTALVSRQRERLALASDLGVLIVVLAFWLTGRLPHSAVGLLLFWAAAGVVGLGLALFAIWAGGSPTGLPPQTLAATWVLSKWASLDILLASIATLMPFFVATAALDSNTAGVYRTLQTALGPLNIVHTTVITAFGLDAWRTATLAGLQEMRRTVGRMTVALSVFGIAYSMAAVVAMLQITGVQHPDMRRIALTMVVVATLGAANSAYNAAALALGFQRSGAFLRAVIVSVTILVSLPISARTWVPWHDPIGVSSLSTAVVTFFGWAVSYFIGSRAEVERLTQREACVEPE